MEKQNCQHKIWHRVGEWDGVNKEDGKPIGGPMIECANCSLKRDVTYPEWAQIEKDMR